MAITEDATTPAVVNSSGVVSTRVTGSFSPPANSLLIALVACYSSGSNGAITVTDSGGHTWTKSVESIGHTTVAIWQCQLTTAPGSITVTAHYSNNAGDEYLAVRVLNGAGTSQTGAGTAVHLVTSATTADTYSLTTTQTGSVVYGITDNWATTDSITPNAATTLLTGSDFTDTPNGAYIVCWKSTSATGTPGATTFGGTWAAAVTDGNVALEILPPPSAFSVSVTATETASPVIAGARTDTSDVSATSTAPSVVGAQAVGPGAAAAVVSVAPVVSATAVGPAAVSAAGTTGATVIGQRTDTGATTPVASALSTVGATSVGPGAVSATESAGSTVTAQRAQTGTLAAVVTAAPSVSAAVTGIAQVSATATASPAVTGNRVDTAAVTAAVTAAPAASALAVSPAAVTVTTTASSAVTGTRSQTGAVAASVVAGPAVTSTRAQTATVSTTITASPTSTATEVITTGVATTTTVGVATATSVRVHPTGLLEAQQVVLTVGLVAAEVVLVQPSTGITRTTSGAHASVDLLH